MNGMLTVISPGFAYLNDVIGLIQCGIRVSGQNHCQSGYFNVIYMK
jgi:hypothetical protein